MIGALAVVAVAIAGFIVWRSQRSLLPTPTDRALSSLRSVLTTLDGLPLEQRHTLAAQAIAEFEEERLPRKLNDAFRRVAIAPPGYGTLAVLEPIAKGDLETEFRRMCPAGPGVLAGMIAEPRNTQGRFVYRQCELERYGFLSEEDAGKADGGAIVLAFMALDILSENRALLAEEQALLRAFTRDTVFMSGVPTRERSFR